MSGALTDKRVKNFIDITGVGMAGNAVGVDVGEAVLDVVGMTAAGKTLGLGQGEDKDTSTTETTSVSDQLQDDATNAARVADATKKKKKTTSSVLTSPLGASTAKTAVTKLGGM